MSNCRVSEQLSSEQLSSEQLSSEQLSVSNCRGEQMSGEQLSWNLHSTLSFDKHFHEKKSFKLKKNIGMLKHLPKFLPLKTLDQI